MKMALVATTDQSGLRNIILQMFHIEMNLEHPHTGRVHNSQNYI